MNDNLLLATDVYKFGGHLQQYPKGTNKIYSYLIARKKGIDSVYFGNQYYLKHYLSKPVTHAHVDEAIMYRKMILGDCPAEIETAWRKLADLGYLPIEIKSVDEGAVIPSGNALMTVTNTLPDFYWLPNMLESFLLKVWNTITVATYSREMKKTSKKYSDLTCDNDLHLNYQVHDFGYRGVSSEESAALSGAAHLLNFMGTDTILGVKLLYTMYKPKIEIPIGLSVPASEHSVMCSFGKENEIDAFKNMLRLYPSGIVSIVIDTYDTWNVLCNFTDILKPEILKREGKVVFRPDSGNPELIINGDPNAKEGSPEYKGALNILGEKFGYTVNQKGFKVLNPSIGLIYGDGIYFERYDRILAEMQRQGWASSNLVVGVGGLLLQNHNRDEQGFAFKATYCEIDSVPREIVKDPKTDHSKKSHKGLLCLQKTDKYFAGKVVGVNYETLDQCSPEQEKVGELKTVFKDGKILREFSLDEIRERCKL